MLPRSVKQPAASKSPPGPWSGRWQRSKPVKEPSRTNWPSSLPTRTAPTMSRPIIRTRQRPSLPKTQPLQRWQSPP
ncbi:hypothetical protein Micbo1qcDRAFT_166161, partial [Microdochium bolleyi]